MTFTIPSAVLPRLTPGKRNRGSLETFQSAYVYIYMTAEICQKESRSSYEGKLGKLTFLLYAKVREKVGIFLHDVT